jgi:hypothetical protein
MASSGEGGVMAQLIAMAKPSAAANGDAAAKKRKAGDETEESDSDSEPAKVGAGAGTGDGEGEGDDEDDDEEDDGDDKANGEGDEGAGKATGAVEAEAEEDTLGLGKMIAAASFLKKHSKKVTPDALVAAHAETAGSAAVAATVSADIVQFLNEKNLKVFIDNVDKIFVNPKFGGLSITDCTAKNFTCCFGGGNKANITVTVSSLNPASPVSFHVSEKKRFLLLAVLQLCSFRNAASPVYWTLKKANKVNDLYRKTKSFISASL